MDTETFVLAHVTHAVVLYSMGYPERAATEFRASMPNDTREEVFSPAAAWLGS